MSALRLSRNLAGRRCRRCQAFKIKEVKTKMTLLGLKDLPSTLEVFFAAADLVAGGQYLLCPKSDVSRSPRSIAEACKLPKTG